MLFNGEILNLKRIISTILVKQARKYSEKMRFWSYQIRKYGENKSNWNGKRGQMS